MTYSQFLRLLVEFTENKPLVVARQSEVLVLYNYATTIPFAATFLIELGMPNNPRVDHS